MSTTLAWTLAPIALTILALLVAALLKRDHFEEVRRWDRAMTALRGENSKRRMFRRANP